MNITEDSNRAPNKQEVAFSIGNEREGMTLKKAIEVRGKPRKIWIHNGSDFRGQALFKWMKDLGFRFPERFESSPMKRSCIHRGTLADNSFIYEENGHSSFY